MVKLIESLSKVDHWISVIEHWLHVSNCICHTKKSLQLKNTHVVVHLTAESCLNSLSLEVILLGELSLARGKLRVWAQWHEGGYCGGEHLFTEVRSLQVC